MGKVSKLTVLGVILGVFLAGGIIVWAGTGKKITPFSRPLDTQSTEGVIDRTRAHALAQAVVNRLYPGARVSEGVLEEKYPGQRQVWSFAFGEAGLLELDAETGRLLVYVYAVPPRGNGGSSQTLLRKEEAIRSARVKVATLGVPLPEAEPEAELVTELGGCSGASVWAVRWPRCYEGYVFREDKIMVTIDAYNGELLGYNNLWFSKTPAELAVNVAAEEAKRAAAAALSPQGKAKIQTPGQLYLVNPNYRWREDKRFIKYPSGETRLAWVFNFTLERQLASGIYKQTGEIWVDARNGEVLGGVISR
jgi:hypothetical protein